MSVRAARLAGPAPSETAKDEPAPGTPPTQPAGGGTGDGPAGIPTENEAYTPARAERVIAEIENGIRKLADLLRNEVNERWAGAREALQEHDLGARVYRRDLPERLGSGWRNHQADAGGQVRP